MSFVDAEEAIDAEVAGAEGGEGDRGDRQVHHVLVALLGDEEPVGHVHGAGRDGERADHGRRGERRPGPGDQRDAGSGLHRGARRRLEFGLLEPDRAEPPGRAVQGPAVPDAVGDHGGADRRPQAQPATSMPFTILPPPSVASGHTRPP